jgi:rod shape-determining protein MreC
MESFFSRYKNALVLIAVLVAQLLALAVQVKRPIALGPDEEGVTLIRYVVASVITPPERWLHNTGLWIRGVWSGYLDLVHVRQEDAALKAQIERLRLEQASLAEDARQGQRLSQLLAFKQHYIYRTVPAQVIGASGTEQSRTLYIDKGLRDGLAPDMPVVTADGIVGRLRDVFDHKSLVLLVSDMTSGVGVVLETTRTRGILKGAPFGQVQVINVSPDDRIKPGERILTSGGDRIFPRGLPVGTVERVTPDPERDPLVDLVVRPAANLSRLEEVLVITDLGETLSTRAQKDLAESEAEGIEEKKRASDVLAERLPSRLDARAPADTNPDSKVGGAASGSTADDVRLLTPPKPLRPDQYSPDATLHASDMVPGQRRAPVLQGAEDAVVPVKRTAPPATAATGATPAGTTMGTGAGGDLKKASAGLASVPAGEAGVAKNTAVSGSRPGGSGTTAGGSTTGLTGSVPKPKPAGSTAAEGGSVTGVSRPAGTASASGVSANGGTPKRTVIVDGPMAAGRTNAASRDLDQAGAPVSAPVKKKPEIVPDDGSRPPSTARPVTPKPKPAVQPAGDNAATPPNGGR